MKASSGYTKKLLHMAPVAILFACHGVLGEQEAQTNSAPPAQKEDIQKLMLVTEAETSINLLLRQLIGLMKLAFPQCSESEWQSLLAAIDVHALLDVATPIYQKHYTKDDVRGLVAFYSTPLGKKTIRESPKIMQELKAVCYQRGMALGDQLAQKAASQSKTNITTGNSQVPATLTPEQKAALLKTRGLDPNEYDIDSNLNIISKPQVEPVFPSAASSSASVATLPSEVGYLIIETMPDGTQNDYFSVNEPKPVGAGFKFKMWPSQTELTVSGSVKIHQIHAK